MALTPMDQLRLYIDDPMPTDGTSDPEFSDDVLQSLLDGVNQSPERAAVEGWRFKAAKAASLVDVTEGNASRAMSDMVAHGLQMMTVFEKSRTGPVEGRTTIGRVRRRNF